MKRRSFLGYLSAVPFIGRALARTEQETDWRPTESIRHLDFGRRLEFDTGETATTYHETWTHFCGDVEVDRVNGKWRPI